MAIKCDICGKIRKHTHILGDLSRTQAEQRYIQDAIAFAQMRGESVSQYTIAGGSMSDINNTLRAKVKEEDKKAKEFRQKVSKELKEQKARGEKPDEKKAIQAAKKKKGFWG
jgi:multidrug efflux pump subunit AcrB